jgi:serine/threonine protein kinase
VLEDIPGITLDDYVQRRFSKGHLSTDDTVARLGGGLAQRLETVHRVGFVYRDLNSRNVLVARDKEIWLVDFELAYDVRSGARPFGKGTVGYMSPNRLRALGQCCAMTFTVLGRSSSARDGRRAFSCPRSDLPFDSRHPGSQHGDQPRAYRNHRAMPRCQALGAI